MIIINQSIKVNSLAFSPHSFHLVSGSSDKTVRLWRTSDGTLLHTFRGHPSMVWFRWIELKLFLSFFLILMI